MYFQADTSKIHIKENKCLYLACKKYGNNNKCITMLKIYNPVASFKY